MEDKDPADIAGMGCMFLSVLNGLAWFLIPILIVIMAIMKLARSCN